MSIFMGLEGVLGVVADEEDAGVGDDPFGGRFKDGFEVGVLPLVLPPAGTLPKDLTPSDFTAGAAEGEVDIGAATSSIEPNVTAEPRHLCESKSEVSGSGPPTLFYCSHSTPRNADAIFYGYTLSKCAWSP